jgi:large subunit ribosomal protein L21
MYAIVEIAGKQFSVREKDRLIVPHLEGNANDSVTLDRVLLIAGKDGVQIGTPVVPDASVKATILEHVKGDKILVFRKKRRKRFKVKRGHRQPYTRIEIGTLSPGGEKKKEAATKKPAAKKPAAKKTAAKKPAAKKTTASAKTADATQKTVKKKPAPKATEKAIPPESEAAS